MSYFKLYQEGILAKRIARLKAMLSPCRLCPRECGAKRLDGETGQCGAGEHVHISGYGPHFGEEPPLVGRGGSGTIFFAYCSLHCVFCQNFDTSRGYRSRRISIKTLAEIMLELEARGCENINFVTPTHFIAQIIEALQLAAERGFRLPLVYNTSGYERIETLKLLDGIIDIYMPDIKYAEEKQAATYSQIKHYPDIAKAALKEMQRQVGDLVVNEEGIAQKGLLIRHLVMPENIAGTTELMKFIAEEISPRAAINIMDQYYPTYQAHNYPEINRRITAKEYQNALTAARRASSQFRLFA